VSVRDPNDITTDPRFIGPNDDGVEIGDLAEQYESELRRLDALQTMFGMDGWEHIRDILRREAESLDRRARGELEPNQWFLWRGQAMTIWYLLDLPDRVEKLQRRTREDYRRLVGEEE